MRERCEICASSIEQAHPHLLERETRILVELWPVRGALQGRCGEPRSPADRSRPRALRSGYDCSRGCVGHAVDPRGTRFPDVRFSAIDLVGGVPEPSGTRPRRCVRRSVGDVLGGAASRAPRGAGHRGPRRTTRAGRQAGFLRGTGRCLLRTRRRVSECAGRGLREGTTFATRSRTSSKNCDAAPDRLTTHREELHELRARPRRRDAVLFEGYALYPYRPSSRKNVSRWQFGVLAPRAYAEDDGGEAWWMETQCLVEPHGNGTLTGQLRFLRLRKRRVFAPGPVPSVEVDGQLFVTWDEGDLREIDLSCDIGRNGEKDFELPGDVEDEVVTGRDGDVAARVERRRSAIAGHVHVRWERVETSQPCLRLIVRVETGRRGTSAARATRQWGRRSSGPTWSFR